jgi:tetratricopeptide (TPR) repeat protein
MDPANLKHPLAKKDPESEAIAKGMKLLLDEHDELLKIAEILVDKEKKHEEIAGDLSASFKAIHAAVQVDMHKIAYNFFTTHVRKSYIEMQRKGLVDANISAQFYYIHATVTYNGCISPTADQLKGALEFCQKAISFRADTKYREFAQLVKTLGNHYAKGQRVLKIIEEKYDEHLTLDEEKGAWNQLCLAKDCIDILDSKLNAKNVNFDVRIRHDLASIVFFTRTVIRNTGKAYLLAVAAVELCTGDEDAGTCLKIYLLRGQILMRMGEYAAARSDLKDCRLLNPNNLDAKHYLRICDNEIRKKQLEDPTSCYSILGVPTTATTAQIKTAYRAKCLTTHPDRYQGETLKAQANKEYLELKEAYDILLDPKKRKEYDEAPDVVDRPNKVRKVMSPSQPSPNPNGMYEEIIPDPHATIDDFLKNLKPREWETE